MQVADSEDEVLPVGVVDLFKEFLIDHGGEGFVKTCFQTLRRLIRHFQHFLKKTQRELVMGFTSYPKSEIFVRFGIIWVLETYDKLFYFFHELQP